MLAFDLPNRQLGLANIGPIFFVFLLKQKDLVLESGDLIPLRENDPGKGKIFAHFEGF